MGELSGKLGIAATAGMLVASNLFMTLAWYWHLRLQKPGGSGWPLAAIIAGVALMCISARGQDRVNGHAGASFGQSRLGAAIGCNLSPCGV